MDIDISTPAILFPTISLFMLAYTNRFSALVNRIRELSEKFGDNQQDVIVKQIYYLEKRVKLVVLMQGLLVASTLLCVLSMISFVFSVQILAKWLFLFSLISITISLIVSFLEINISSSALKIQLSEIKSRI